MILRILLLLAAYNAMENQRDQHVNGCVYAFAGVGICCAIGGVGYFYLKALEKAQNDYNAFEPQNSIVPSNCNLIYQNDQVCLTIAAAGYAVQNVVEKCFPNVLNKVRACLSSDGNNYATGITKDCSEEDLKKIKEQNQKIMDLIKEKTNLQPFVCRKFPTGLKIHQNLFGYVFKNPTKTSKSGCFGMTQTPQLSTSHCGKHAEMQLLPVGGHDFWTWAGTDWEITFPMLAKQNPFKDYRMQIKKDTNAWTNRLYEDFMHDLSLNLFKRRTYSIFINGNPIARMNVQYLDGEKWYRVCKQRSGREYLSWDQKCDINSFFASFHGYIDVPVRVEIEARTPQGQTSFRSQSRFTNGFLSSSASSGVFQCYNDWSGSWYNNDVNYGCDLVLRSNTGFKFSDFSGFGKPLWPKLEVSNGGADPLALMNLHASEYYTSKIRQDWERQYFKDKRIVEEREERERERQREIERQRKQREREREQRNQARTHSQNHQNSYSHQNQRYQPNSQQNQGYRPNNPRQGGPIKMTKEEEEYVKKQDRQNQGYNPNGYGNLYPNNY